MQMRRPFHQNGTTAHSFSLNPMDICMQMSHGSAQFLQVSRRRERQPQDGADRQKPARRAI